MRSGSFRWVVLDRPRRCSPLMPLYVMVTSSLKPLGGRPGRLPLAAHAPDLPAVHRHLEHGAAGAATSPTAWSCRTVATVVQRRDRDLRGVRGQSRYRFRGRTRVHRERCCRRRCSPASCSCCRCSSSSSTSTTPPASTLCTRPGLGLIITYLTFSLPFSIWMLVGYFDTIPRDLDEAAQVDGARPDRRAVPGRPAGGRARASSRSPSTRS